MPGSSMVLRSWVQPDLLAYIVPRGWIKTTPLPSERGGSKNNKTEPGPLICVTDRSEIWGKGKRKGKRGADRGGGMSLPI